VQVVFTDPSGAWFRSDEVEPGDLAIVSPIQAAFTGMSITILERLEDGTIFTHEPVDDDAEEAGADAVAMRQASGG
jgi:hypothetical protein